MSDSLDSANRSPDRYLEAATYGFAPNAAPLEAPPQPRRELDAASTRRFADVYRRLVVEIEKAFVGQRELVVGALVALFSGGHVLVESVPGLGKTLFAQALGRALGCQFGRVQFTPDLTPSDVVGALVFNAKEQEFTFRPGPIFTQILLADEINRSPAKTHAALLEATQEGAATVDGQTYPLPRPFFTIATQNPIESEGTYRLPEAQLDRFMFKLVADYPSAEEETRILVEHGKNVALQTKLDAIRPVLTAEEVLTLTSLTNDVYVAPQLFDYVVKIVRATRDFPRLAFGASPRAGLALVQGARVLAAFEGRGYATPDDVARLVLPTLRHRVVLSPEAEIEGRRVDDVLTALLRSIDVPRL
ncbi:MAG: MoxR family ATPase [Thermoguttaceae bacterium]|nr:MoxR family ATPase [Thermoguttaceae bacterium]MBR4102915.1 MoxR family ATPase [Thermoguttaceae bacterium]